MAIQNIDPERQASKDKWKKELTAINRKIGNHLTWLRELKGVTQQDVADKICADKSKISMVENGRSTLSVEVMIAYSKALEIPITRLLEFDDSEEILNVVIPTLSPEYSQILIAIANTINGLYRQQYTQSDQDIPRPSSDSVLYAYYAAIKRQDYQYTVPQTENRFVLLDKDSISKIKDPGLRQNLLEEFDLAEHARDDIAMALKNQGDKP